jgi:streptogramin lyase
MVSTIPGRRCHLRRLALISLLTLAFACAVAAAGGQRHATIRLRAGSFPDDVAQAYGAIWVASHRGYGITMIDPKTNRASYLTLPTNQCGPLAAGAGRVWFSNCSGETPNPLIYALNPTTGKVVARTPGQGVAFADRSVWTIRLGNAKDILVRLDPRTRVALARIPLPITPDPNGQFPGSYGLRALWLCNSDDAVVRVDPATNTVAAVIPLPGGHSATTGYFSTGRLAFAAGRVWVPTPGGLYEINPRTNTAARLPIALHGFSQLGDVDAVSDGNNVYVRTSDQTIVEIDAASRTIVKHFPAPPTGGGGGFTVAHRSLWVANAGDDTVWREPIP